MRVVVAGQVVSVTKRQVRDLGRTVNWLDHHPQWATCGGDLDAYGLREPGLVYTRWHGDNFVMAPTKLGWALLVTCAHFWTAALACGKKSLHAVKGTAKVTRIMLHWRQAPRTSKALSGRTVSEADVCACRVNQRPDSSFGTRPVATKSSPIEGT